MNKEEKKNKAVMGNQQKQVDQDTDDEKFPAGIHVLAVDDDMTCLMWLEHLLHECHYKVTTTLHAREALQMLRQNKKKYDIVITDVQMPDIDGFQLLETIALEMDLPVIMLSVHNDKEYVERGVMQGAVDYLLKPVREEEIQNIWQHVLRRRCRQHQVANQDSTQSQGGNVVDAVVGDSTVSAGEASNRKQRDPADKENEDCDEEDGSGRENDEQTSQKRPRTVWTSELHRKFVIAVNQLGTDKAVPKKILDRMDIEGLTRENIASHLQKYRLYLKRMNNGSQQQMLGGLGGINSLDAMDYGNPKMPNSLMSGYPSSLSGILGAKQNPSAVNFCSLSSSDLIRSGQNLRNSISPNALLFPNGNLFQGGIGQDRSQVAGKVVAHVGDFNQGATGFGAFKIGDTTAGFLDHSATPSSWESAAQLPINGAFSQNHVAMNGNGTISAIQPQQLLADNVSQRWEKSDVFGAMNPFLKPNGMDQTPLGAPHVGDFMGQLLATTQGVNNNDFIEQAPDGVIASSLQSMEDIVNNIIAKEGN